MASGNEMTSQNSRQRLFIALALMATVMVGASFWLKAESNKPYKKYMIAGSELYVPKKFTGPKPDSLMEIFQEYVDGFSENQRFYIEAGELLDNRDTLTEWQANSEIVWTISPAKEPADDETFSDSSIVEADSFETETLPNGLMKIYSNPDDRNVFTITNKREIITGNSAPWATHCIEFRAIRENGSWGKCTYQMRRENLQVTVHYDGILVEHTGQISSKVKNELQSWLQTPHNP